MDSGLLRYAQSGWLLCLVLLTVHGIEAKQLKNRLFATGHSKWWTVPLLLTIIGLAACPPRLGRLRVLLVLAFIVPQFPLFIDKNESPEEGGQPEL